MLSRTKINYDMVTCISTVIDYQLHGLIHIYGHLSLKDMIDIAKQIRTCTPKERVVLYITMNISN